MLWIEAKNERTKILSARAMWAICEKLSCQVRGFAVGSAGVFGIR